MILTPLSVVLLAAVVGMGVAVPVWLHRDSPGAAPLAVFVTLVWSNGAHGLVWTMATTTLGTGTSTLAPVWGLARWGHLAYMLVLILSGGVLLLRTMVRTNEFFQGQVLSLLVAITVPAVSHSVYALGLLSLTFDPTSLAYVISGIVLSLALLRGQLLDVAPVTRDLGQEVMFSEMDDAFVIVDGNGRIVDVNAAAVTLFGAGQEAIAGRSLATELPALAEAVPGEGERAQTEMRLDRDGAIRYYDARIIPLYRTYGVVSGHLISLRDVTRRRQREQRIDVLNRLLRHNIRNEMNVVRGNVDLLQDSDGPPDGERMDRILRTVDSIVDRSNKIGRVSEALETEHSRPVDVRQLLEPVVEAANERHPEAAITLSAPEECHVEGAPSLTLAFEELLDNAVEHGDAEPTVSISVTEIDSCVVVYVSDDGPGIAQHERDVILSGEETPLKHGSGVGLWLVKWLVRNVGGTLSFRDDGGTTVAVELPSATCSQAAQR